MIRRAAKGRKLVQILAALAVLAAVALPAGASIPRPGQLPGPTPEALLAAAREAPSPSAVSASYDASFELFAEPVGDRFHLDLQAAADAPALARFHLLTPRKTRVRGFRLPEPLVIGVELPPSRTAFRLYGDVPYGFASGGLYVTTDPLGYVDGPNLYQYGLNNPANFSDPMGLETKAEWQALLKQELDNYGVDLDDWDPSKGWEHNEKIVRAVYDWYRDMHGENAYMVWTGLARMVGAPVVDGLERSEKGRGAALAAAVVPFLGPDATDAGMGLIDLTQEGFLTINRDIFLDLAWHHKAYAEKGIAEINERLAAREIDEDSARGWRLIDKGRKEGDSRFISAGNVRFALREQRDVVNRGYDLLGRVPFLIGYMSRAAKSPVPGGSPFKEVANQPPDISLFLEQRWQWIVWDMWPAWTALSREEQLHYTQMPLDQLIQESSGF